MTDDTVRPSRRSKIPQCPVNENYSSAKSRHGAELSHGLGRLALLGMQMTADGTMFLSDDATLMCIPRRYIWRLVENVEYDARCSSRKYAIPYPYHACATGRPAVAARPIKAERVALRHVRRHPPTATNDARSTVTHNGLRGEPLSSGKYTSRSRRLALSTMRSFFHLNQL